MTDPYREGRSARTRRRFLATAGAFTGATLLAGCAGNSGSGGDTTTETPTTTAENTTTTTTRGSESYSVKMAPAGQVTFEETPERWETYFPGYADMGVALGVSDGLSAVGFKARYHTDYYEQLDGVSIDKKGLTELIGDGGIDKEIYYELDNDVHVTDPQWLINNSFFGLEADDIDELRTNVAPFIGNTIFRRTDDWHTYRYYTLYEAFEKVAAIFQTEDRFAAFETFHDDFVADIQASLPPADERPNGLLCFAASDEPEKFSPYRLTDKGTNKKHFRDLGVADALAGTGIDGLSTTDRGQIDYETILQVDPDTLFVRGHETKSRAEFEDTVVAFMREHPVAGQLTAVENDAVIRGGPIYQGPIQNLFLTERFATALYPDVFTEEELFDRDAIAAIINGTA